METTQNEKSLKCSLDKGQGKDKDFEIQLDKVSKAFFDKPKTMKEVDKETGIMRENICRYCKTLREAKMLFAVSKRRCNVTKWNGVTEWSTNPIYAPKPTQLNLFSNEK